MNLLCAGSNSVYDKDYFVHREADNGKFMLILLKSRAVFRFGDKLEEAPCGSLILYDGSCVQEYEACGEYMVCDWLCFDTEGDSDYFDTLEIPFNTLIRYTDTEFFSGLIRNITTEFYSVSTRRTKLIDSMIKMLLIRVSEQAEIRNNTAMPVSDPHYSTLSELRDKIYRNPQMKWSVNTLAADVNMSRSYFQHIYRETFGVSCITDVISGKIKKAKELLSETSCTVSQVAAMCGYDNEEHFMRQFKKLVGMTPTAYRKKG